MEKGGGKIKRKEHALTVPALRIRKSTNGNGNEREWRAKMLKMFFVRWLFVFTPKCSNFFFYTYDVCFILTRT